MSDRAAIFRIAHAAARKRCEPSHFQRYGDTWIKNIGWVPKATYREIFAGALKQAWRDAKTIARFAAYEAEAPVLPAEIVERVAAMRADAWFEPITAAGNDRMFAIFAEAAAIKQAASLFAL